MQRPRWLSTQSPTTIRRIPGLTRIPDRTRRRTSPIRETPTQLWTRMAEATQTQTLPTQTEYDFQVLEQCVPDDQLNIAEEDWIRAGGGPAKKGGSLENKRYQMNNESYEGYGGSIPKPTE